MVARFQHTHWRWVVVLLLAALFPPRPGGAEPLKPREGYDLIVRAIADQLERPERFTPLPNNITGLSVRPEGKPVFSILAGTRGEELQPNASKSAYLKDEGSFLVSRFGTVACAHKDSIVLERSPLLMKQGVDYTLMVVNPSGAKPLGVSFRKSVNQVFWAGSDWGFVLYEGIKLDSSTNLQVAVPAPQQLAKVFETDSGLVMVTRPGSQTGYDENNDLAISVKNERGLKQSFFKGYREVGRKLQALLPLADGRLLAIAEKLVILRTECPPAPTELELQSVLSAFQKQDREQFAAALRVATEYPASQSKDLALKLREAPDSTAAYRYVESAARNALEATKGQAGDANTERMNAALKAFLEAVEAARTGVFGVSQARAAELVRDGYQYFDGQWIRQPQVVRQEASAVVLDATFMDSAWKSGHGVFRLDHRGRLERLFTYERDAFAPPCQIFKNASGQDLIFFPFEGLARFDGGKLEWLDRSDEMKWMERVLGCDQDGRIYFSSPESKPAGGCSGSYYKSSAGWVIWGKAVALYGEKGYWVYRPNVAPARSPVQRLFPVAHYPVMDSARRVWFCPTVPPRFALAPAPGSLAECPATVLALQELAAAPPRSLRINTLSRGPDRTFGAVEIDAQLDLFCREDGQVTRCLTNLPLSTTLLGGTNGCVLGTVQDRDDQGAFIIEDGQSATLAASLHRLVEQDFSLLFNAAPPVSQPPGFNYLNSIIHSIHFNPSLCRVNELLWLNDRDKVEVYRDSKSLGFQMKLTIPSKALALLGPVNAPGGYRMLVCNPRGSDVNSTQASIGFLWAAPASNGVEVVGVDRWPLGGIGVTPVFNPNRGTFYLEETLTSCREVAALKESRRLFDTGNPVIALKNGDWIFRSTTPFSSYRIVSGERVEDLKLSLSRRFEILAETGDERLLCAAPDGILWLRRKGNGQYAIGEELPLRTGGFAFSFVGEDAGHVYLTLADARCQVYLAVVERKPVSGKQPAE